METRKCTRCLLIKPITEFHKYKCGVNGFKPDCKDCRIIEGTKYNKSRKEKNPNCWRDQARKYRSTFPDKVKDIDLRRKYNITLDEYNKIFAEQEGKCAICGIHQSELNRPLGVDHDHKTNKIRGLLCNSCNSVLGYSKDDVNILTNSIKYLHGIL
jgi:hypothetical protein